MKVKIQRYLVLLADPAHPDDIEHGSEHEVAILHGDMLRAELEGPKNGITLGEAAPMHNVTLWVWAALMRTHVIDEPFQTFTGRMLGFDQVKDEVDTAPGEQPPPGPADPTPLGAGTSSLSSSPTSSETSVAGSTLTSTPV